MPDILKSAQAQIDDSAQQIGASVRSSPPTDPNPPLLNEEALLPKAAPVDDGVGDLDLPYSSRGGKEPTDDNKNDLPQESPLVIPPPVANKQGNKSLSKSLIIAVLLFLIATIPLTVYFVSQQRQLAQLRSRAQQGPYPAGYECNKNSDCSSGYCDGPSGVCKPKNFAPPTPTPIPSSFVSGTHILTSRGNVPIESIHVGDTVVSFDPVTQTVQPNGVEQVFTRTSDHYYRIELTNQRVLEVTEYHPIYRGRDYLSPYAKDNTDSPIPYYRGFELVKNLSIGDTVYALDENGALSPTAIQSIQRIHASLQVYNLQVVGAQTYFAQGIAVHNKGKDFSKKAGEDCTDPKNCYSGICLRQVCAEKQQNGFNCNIDANCVSGYCDGPSGICKSKGARPATPPAADPCYDIAYPPDRIDCYRIRGTSPPAPKPNGSSCSAPGACISGICSPNTAGIKVCMPATTTPPKDTSGTSSGVCASQGTNCDDFGTGTSCEGTVTIHICKDGPSNGYSCDGNSKTPGPICVNPGDPIPGKVDCVEIANRECAFVQLDTPNGSAITCYPTKCTSGSTPTPTQPPGGTPNPTSPPGGTPNPTSPPGDTDTPTPTETPIPGGTCELIKVYDSDAAGTDITQAIRSGTRKLAIGEEITLATTIGNATKARFRIQGIAEWAENDPSKTTETEYRLTIHIPSTMTQAQGTFEVEVFVNGQWK